MASSLVIHIAAGEDKHTEVLSQDRIRIGACEDCDLRLRASSLPPGSAPGGVILELARTNGNYRVKDFDQSLNLTHNGKPLSLNTRIRDGDEVRCEPGLLALSFFPLSNLPAVIATRQQTQVAPFIETAAMESRTTARRDDAKVFLREFSRELVREIRPTTKIITLIIALALVGGILYLGFGLYNELKRNRRMLGELGDQMAQAKGKIAETGKQIQDIDRSNQTIIDSLSLAPKLRSDYGGGVCMILGTYYFVESGTGRPLRYPEVQTSEDGTVVQGDDRVQLTPEGKGAVAEFEAVGTGFHVGGGYLLTNRHVAQPWLADERAQILSSSVRGQPRLKKLIAYFPDHTQPVTLKFKVAAQRDDVAVCTFEVKDAPTDIPVLPLDKDGSTAISIGRTVVLMGYPNGPDRLLALRDDAEAYMIRARCGSSLETLLGCLSEKNRIQPLTTQGNITDLAADRVVYDARTAEGGSGAPLFGQSGRVIGVNFAVFTESDASNFAVPIRSSLSLLQRAGWEAPEDAQAESNSNENANSNQTSTRSPGATTNPSR